MEFSEAVLCAAHLSAEFIGGHSGPARAEDGAVFRKETIAGKVVERGEKEALGQVATGSEDHKDAGFARGRGGQDVSGGIWELGSGHGRKTSPGRGPNESAQVMDSELHAGLAGFGFPGCEGQRMQ